MTLLRWRRPANLFQPYATTTTNRYPAVFQLARDLLGDGPDMRLLSFGCATGEEVFSLRRYFSQASIHGIDINPRSIAVCRKVALSLNDPGLSFAVAGTADDLAEAGYDGVFAMAVFRH